MNTDHAGCLHELKWYKDMYRKTLGGPARPFSKVPILAGPGVQVVGSRMTKICEQAIKYFRGLSHVLVSPLYHETPATAGLL